MKSIAFILLLIVVATVNVAWATTSASCDPSCGFPTGTCQSDGQCLCWWGWTGPHTNLTSVYVSSGENQGRVLTSEGCTFNCTYTLGYENPACAHLPQPCAQDCSFPTGTCENSSGFCSCAVGWTGATANVSRYVVTNNGQTVMVVTTDGSACSRACNYGQDNLDPNCALSS